MNTFAHSSHTVGHSCFPKTFFPSSSIETSQSCFLLVIPWFLSVLCPSLICWFSSQISSWLPCSVKSFLQDLIYLCVQTPSTHTGDFHVFVSTQINMNIFRQFSQLSAECLDISLTLKKNISKMKFISFFRSLC